MREFESGATRDDADDKLDYGGFNSPYTMKRFAEYMHQHRIQADGKLRPSDNWKKGIPLSCYMESMWRHFMEVWFRFEGLGYEEKGQFGSELSLAAEVSELLCALKFNVDGMLHEIEQEASRGKEDEANQSK